MKWHELRGQDLHRKFLAEVSQVCADLGGPLSAKLNRLIQAGRFRDVVEIDFDYQRGHDRNDYLYARQIAALVEKQDVFDLGYDKEKRAVRAFIEAEKKCQDTNLRLTLPCPDRDVSAVLHYAVRKIAEVLGPVPSLGSLDFFFGPGATTNVKGSAANSRSKLSARMACSKDMLPHLGEFLEELPLWVSTIGERVGEPDEVGSFQFSVPVDVHAARLCFVPKNSKTYRPICVEPVLNSLFQKGIGLHMKKRLRKFGVDLYDQTRNQELARRGSESGLLATIDLKSASDTVAIGLVLNLLPPDWVDLLSACRSGEIEYEGTIHELEKFSSMGNGYTFELESLIFFGLMSGVLAHLRHKGEVGNLDTPLGVYGDDLIVPSFAYELAERVLAYCGFDVNPKKSFSHGPFRESCGADYFLGYDVRPFYLRKEMSDQVLYSFHNWAVRRGEREIANLCLRWTNRKGRLWGPDGYGDGHLVGTYSLRVPRVVQRRGWDGGYFRSYALLPKRDSREYPLGDILMPAYTAYSRASAEGPVDTSVIRGSRGTTVRRLYTNRRGVFL
jgi:hypothetical protein